MAATPDFGALKGRDPTIPPYSGSDSDNIEYGIAKDASDKKLSLLGRLGCTPESFKKRTLADAHNQLNQTLKPRHLHMIAIGTLPYVILTA